MELPSRLVHLEPYIRARIASRPAFIYALTDPRDEKPRWVGSALDVKDRARQHWRDACAGYTRSNQGFYEWLCSLDQPPPYTILAEVSQGTVGSGN
jgi:hypothetical protein